MNIFSLWKVRAYVYRVVTVCFCYIFGCKCISHPSAPHTYSSNLPTHTKCKLWILKLCFVFYYKLHLAIVYILTNYVRFGTRNAPCFHPPFKTYSHYRQKARLKNEEHTMFMNGLSNGWTNYTRYIYILFTALSTSAMYNKEVNRRILVNGTNPSLIKYSC